MKTAKEWTRERDLEVAKSKDGRSVKVRIHPGDVQVVGIELVRE